MTAQTLTPGECRQRRRRIETIKGDLGALVIHEEADGGLEIAYHGFQGFHLITRMDRNDRDPRSILMQACSLLDRLESYDPTAWKEFHDRAIHLSDGTLFKAVTRAQDLMLPILHGRILPLEFQGQAGHWQRVDLAAAGLLEDVRRYHIQQWLESEGIIGAPDWYAMTDRAGGLEALLVLWEDAIDLAPDQLDIALMDSSGDRLEEMIDGIAGVYIPTRPDQLPDPRDLSCILDLRGCEMCGSIGMGRLLREYEIILTRKRDCENHFTVSKTRSWLS